MKIDGELLNNLSFSDDIFLCTGTPQTLQQMLQQEVSNESSTEGPTSGSEKGYKVILYIINNVTKMKWSRAGHVNLLKHVRWTSRLTTWRPYDKKRRQRSLAKQWRDDLDEYWTDTIWYRTAQDRITWWSHAEVFAQPQTLRLPNDDAD